MKVGDMVRVVSLEDFGDKREWAHGYIFVVVQHNPGHTFPVQARSIISNEVVYFHTREVEPLKDTDDGR